MQREIRKDAETCIHSFFNSIFVHRYKDAHHEVRAKCTEAVGKLIMEYSTKFLDNQFLKYIGWALYDKSTDVRLMALDAVDRFYNSQLVNNLEAFTTRFRHDRLLVLISVCSHSIPIKYCPACVG